MPWSRLPGRVLGLQSHETGPVAMAFGYFFCLLASYYLLRPVRDEMGIRAGVEDLQWLFTATFLVMLALTPAFGRASAALPRKRLIPGVYVFFGASLLLFYLLFVVLPRHQASAWALRSSRSCQVRAAKKLSRMYRMVRSTRPLPNTFNCT